jgi:hypothetical protein
LIQQGSGTAKPTSANKPKKGDVYELGTNEQLIMSKQVRLIKLLYVGLGNVFKV